ncbi:hypothetical protein KM176_03610 [Pseudooceanicola sp. CBS1P-1]|uniref:Uncharacterized protein n=1 Tax=Pseudooceanicola albus TaxID=2692189 RepID=A0A6L7G9R3_9RHOB|nr:MULTISPECIES: hypothetical protein [Pseudooceanicola]MBT9382940.1 hypothetical protein [Pseudooceanicola endophyticus]MXN20136.1 hypothetical protein [Pseudooceanicola albus]
MIRMNLLLQLVVGAALAGMMVQLADGLQILSRSGWQLPELLPLCAVCLLASGPLVRRLTRSGKPAPKRMAGRSLSRSLSQPLSRNC